MPGKNAGPKKRRGRRTYRDDYTPLGRRIAQLGTQAEIARMLGVRQQTISKKLRGKCAIAVEDLETLARKAKKPVAWFFLDDPAFGAGLRAILDVLQGRGGAHSGRPIVWLGRFLEDLDGGTHPCKSST